MISCCVCGPPFKQTRCLLTFGVECESTICLCHVHTLHCYFLLNCKTPWTADISHLCCTWFHRFTIHLLALSRPTLRTQWTGEMAHQLRACTALAPDPSSIPNTRTGQLTTTVTPATGNPMPPSGPQRHCTHMHIPNHRHTFTYNLRT